MPPPTAITLASPASCRTSARRRLDAGIELDERTAEALRQQRPDRALAGAAQTQQRHVRPGAGDATAGEQIDQLDLEHRRQRREPQQRRVGAAGFDVGEETFADSCAPREIATAPVARIAQRAHPGAEARQQRVTVVQK
jgi:hypothetical protein